jgi:hypothetical protein
MSSEKLDVSQNLPMKQQTKCRKRKYAKNEMREQTNRQVPSGLTSSDGAREKQ